MFPSVELFFPYSLHPELCINLDLIVEAPEKNADADAITRMIFSLSSIWTKTYFKTTIEYGRKNGIPGHHQKQ